MGSRVAGGTSSWRSSVGASLLASLNLASAWKRWPNQTKMVFTTWHLPTAVSQKPMLVRCLDLEYHVYSGN